MQQNSANIVESYLFIYLWSLIASPTWKSSSLLSLVFSQVN